MPLKVKGRSRRQEGPLDHSAGLLPGNERGREGTG